MKTFYLHIIAESWDLCRKHLFLWPLALLTTLVGIAGTFQIFFDISGSDGFLSAADWYNQGDFMTSTFIGWSASFEQIPWGSLTFDQTPLVMFFFLLLFIVLALTILIISSEGGLVYALNQLQSKKKATYLASLRQGIDKFWQLFSINLVYRLVYVIIVTLLILPLIYVILTAPIAYRLIFATLVYLILIPLVIVLDLIMRYSLMYIMIYNNTIRESLRNAWLLFCTNWIISLETSVLILCSLAVAFLIISLFIIPFMILLFMMFSALVLFSSIVFNIFVIIALSLVLIVFALMVSLFTALQMSIWVGVFRKLTTGEHQSKIHRVFRHVPWLHRHIA